jgi:hypothetical protein
MFVFSTGTYLLMADMLISTKITIFNPCHPLSGLCCSFLPKQKYYSTSSRHDRRQHRGGTQKIHENIAQNKLELK